MGSVGLLTTLHICPRYPPWRYCIGRLFICSRYPSRYCSLHGQTCYQDIVHLSEIFITILFICRRGFITILFICPRGFITMLFICPRGFITMLFICRRYPSRYCLFVIKCLHILPRQLMRLGGGKSISVISCLHYKMKDFKTKLVTKH
jgi:hypothetical protein